MGDESALRSSSERAQGGRSSRRRGRGGRGGRAGRRRLPSPRRRSSRAPPPFLASAAAGPELRWPSVASLAGRRRLPGFAAEKVVGCATALEAVAQREDAVPPARSGHSRHRSVLSRDSSGASTTRTEVGGTNPQKRSDRNSRARQWRMRFVTASGSLNLRFSTRNPGQCIAELEARQRQVKAAGMQEGMELFARVQAYRAGRAAPEYRQRKVRALEFRRPLTCVAASK